MLARIRSGGGAMTRIDDVRKTIETTLGTLTPAKAQQLAKGMLEPDARKEQVAKTASDLLEWSQRNRQRLRDLVRREIREQLEQIGVATRADLDAVKKRVRELERNAGMTASGRRAAASAGTPTGAKRAKATAKAPAKTAATSKTAATAKAAARSTAKGSVGAPTPRMTDAATAKGAPGPKPSGKNPAANG